MKRTSPIASVGTVNLNTGKISKAEWHCWETIFDCWEEGHGTNILMRNHEGKLRIVHTSCESTEYPADTIIELEADQTRRYMGRWTVVATAPHTQDGLKSFTEYGVKSARIATFK